MKEYIHSLKGSLSKGLTPFTTTPRNVQHLLVSEGVYPEDETSVSLETVTRLNTDILGLTYPYPQIFELASDTLICGPNDLWTYKNGVFTNVITGLTEGVLWSCADFQSYLILTNGYHIVVRDAETKLYTVFDGLYIPYCGTLCATPGGQLILGSPDHNSLDLAQFTREGMLMQYLHTIVNNYLPQTYPW